MIECGASIKEACHHYSVAESSFYLFVQKNKIKVQSVFQETLKKNNKLKPKARVLRQKGLAFEEIARRLKTNPTSIKAWCSDIPISDEQKQINNGSHLEKQRLAVQYRLEGKYTTEIAKILDCSKSSVSLWLSHAKKLNKNLDDSCEKRKKQERLLKTHRVKPRKNSKAKFGVIKNRSFLTINEIREDLLFLKGVGYSLKEASEKLKIPYTKRQNTVTVSMMSSQEVEDSKKLTLLRNRMLRGNGTLKPQGGARKGSGHSKSGYYKGVYCGSTYELCWAIYQFDHNIPFTRFEGFVEDKKNKLKYYPDFLLSDGKTIVELKGYEREESVQKKTKLAQSKGYKVIVLRKKDLKEVFEYVDKKYGVYEGTRHTLYDDHRPLYSFTCSNCNKEFTREKDYKKDVFLCSRVCTGKYNGRARHTKHP